ncbi:conserved Plasmodium protein, unknown function [Plasmodium chabaudi chabaudi]|uniref:Uncharacterized protein n=2 Tax=Plasmodium chabaudi TaxID=5825 RepID=A0A077YEE2_PLACU|nr:conserved Plasmodium protein, unknown function [Plasmodium chabaudi chabaudi]SCM04451.1 conserved Plasmodium protein, unknown function [Plasmodium chabaudi chabaudi]SCM07339.1 conserved Plasmodium protein, unknown function [Plasmodium chabaudi adami]SCM10644.1 conserved Plasmodium protein, unknown function [Plasmodium chabaudi adami]VTZ66516.1 conserved Plasmodium protein, unknown function [Plasmodium chabaudi chabaudi]|eukprot:XP_016655569.1 conserved Plasmodium protein, unknown function [Plasmodium chabaudi chabaudi]
MIFMGLNSDYNARINLKLKFIVKSIIKVLTKHLILISILNLIISLCHNYAIDRDSNNQLNIVAHLLRGTFVSSVPSCITLSLLIFFKEHSLNNYMYKEWNFLNIICVILTFYSIFYTKTVFSKDYGNNIYDVLYVASISYILQKRFNTKKMGIHDFQHCINSETKNIFDLIQKGIILNIIPLTFSYVLSFIIDILLTIINSISLNIILSILTHPFDVILNLPSIYNLSNIYVLSSFSYCLSILSAIWISAILEYHFIIFNFLFNKYDYTVLTSLNKFPVHNQCSYHDEFFVVTCIYNYLKDVSYRIKGHNIEITNMDKKTKLKLLLFKKLILINASLKYKDEINILSHICNPINTILFEDNKFWNSYIDSCILCIEDLICQLKRYINILNHNQTVYSIEEKLELKNIMDKHRINKLKDTIVLTCIYLKGVSLWSIAIIIICKNVIVSVIRKLSSIIVSLSYVLFDFLNFIKINELYDPLHHLLYEMNSIVDIFKFYKEDILDNKYQYSYNLYKGLSYLFRNKSLNY